MVEEWIQKFDLPPEQLAAIEAGAWWQVQSSRIETDEQDRIVEVIDKVTLLP